MNDNQSQDTQVYTFRRVAILLGLLLFAIVAGFATVVVATGMTGMPGESASKPLPELTVSERRLGERIESHVRSLATGIGERNMQSEGSLEAAARWIEAEFRAAGHEPERHVYQLSEHRLDGLAGRDAVNIIAELPGTTRPEEIVILGAHYDTVRGSPGANDNASGVAVLLELARAFRDRPQPQTVRFIAFTNEEPPFFMTDDMGSYVYAARSRRLSEHINAMISLDGVGYYSDEPRSQDFPIPGMGLLYPRRGNFIAFVTRMHDTTLMHRALEAFRDEGTMPSEGAALPGGIPGVGWSDHWSFWQHHYRALLVTDTLPRRDPQYHAPGDTPDRLDYERMARLTLGLQAVIEALAK